MTSVEREESIFRMIAAHDLQECRQILYSTNADLPLEQKSSLIKYAVICFIRPFKTNYGNLKKHSLTESEYIESDDLRTYYYFCELRDRLIAHSDLNYLNHEYLSPDAIGVGLELSAQDYEEIAENLMKLSRKVFNQLAQQIETNVKNNPPKTSSDIAF